jgi:hypothetical protein
MSRLWLIPPQINVITVEDLPQCFSWKGTTHQVIFVAQRWRLDVEWWRIRLWRDYYKLTTDTGLLVVIYQNLLTDTWYLERIYD